MKKYIITISLACVIVIIVVLILLGLRSIDEDIPSYRFLGGRNPTACKDAKTGSVDKLYIYSFEADFNDVCLNAKTELISAGFVDRTHPGNVSSERRYWLKGSFPRGPIDINILNNYEHIEHPISKEGGLGHKDGWVNVEVRYGRGWWGLF